MTSQPRVFALPLVMVGDRWGCFSATRLEDPPFRNRQSICHCLAKSSG